jgi:predicted aconitase with swiveling domain
MAEARTLVAGSAEGDALVLEAPLSFWGGIDPATGTVIDVHHPQVGANVAGRILVMPSGRGSSSSSSVLAEAIRAGTAPAAIVLLEADAILALGAIVARELSGATIPIVVMREPLRPATRMRVEAVSGSATVEPAPAGV